MEPNGVVSLMCFSFNVACQTALSRARTATALPKQKEETFPEKLDIWLLTSDGLTSIDRLGPWQEEIPKSNCLPNCPLGHPAGRENSVLTSSNKEYITEDHKAWTWVLWIFWPNYIGFCMLLFPSPKVVESLFSDLAVTRPWALLQCKMQATRETDQRRVNTNSWRLL